MSKFESVEWARDYDHSPVDSSNNSYHDRDVFGREEGHDIKYKTLSWQIVTILMVAEIVSNGMLSLPSSLATVGMAPGIILIVFLGIFAAWTSIILVRFKLRHPEVHNMGDAGYIMFGFIGREVFSFGTLLFAVCLAGGQMLSGQIALTALSDHAICNVAFTGIFCAATFLLALPRTFDHLGWVSVASVISILIAGIVGMVGAGIHPTEPREVDAAISSNFQTAFFSITNPVFAYCGHFMFFALMSEMKKPQDAVKSAYALQGFATTYYAVFAAITYAYIGNKVQSPSFLSLPDVWEKASFGIALPNLLIAGSLYVHTASKIVFIRIFRNSRHLHSNSLLGWSVWVFLIAFTSAVAFVLAVGVPVFNYLIGITASLFAAWFTYGIAGMFILYDSYIDGDGVRAWRRSPLYSLLAAVTVLVGAFICVAGMYSNVWAIVQAYADGQITGPFSC